MIDDQSFDGRCPTCGQSFMGARTTPSEPGAVRPWGYYWVTTEEDDDGDEASLAEWCCSDRQRNEGHWWFCGSGAYDDSPRVKSVLAGPLVPPRPRPPWMANRGCPGCGSQSEWCVEGCPLIRMTDDQRRQAYALRDLTVPPTGRIIPE